MMNLLLGIVALLVAGFGFCLWAAMRAPVGYQDEQGFHYGPDAENPHTGAEDFAGAVPALGR